MWKCFVYKVFGGPPGLMAVADFCVIGIDAFTKINISKYLCSVLHDSTISNFHFLKKNFRQVEQALLNIDSKLLQIEKNSAGSFYPEEMLEKISECKRQLEKLEFDFQKLEEEISKWQSPN